MGLTGQYPVVNYEGLAEAFDGGGEQATTTTTAEAELDPEGEVSSTTDTSERAAATTGPDPEPSGSAPRSAVALGVIGLAATAAVAGFLVLRSR